jgi:hypothetical protein
VVEVNLIEKNLTTVTKKQRGGDCDQLEDVARVQNPVKIREFVIICNRDQETQTIKPKTSEEILESSDASSVAVLKFIPTPCTLYSYCVFSHGFCVLQNCNYIVYSVCFNNTHLFNKKPENIILFLDSFDNDR